MPSTIAVCILSLLATIVASVDPVHPTCLNNQGPCEWYLSCIEKNYPCNNTDYAYATDFVYKYCSKFMTDIAEFSEQGQAWLNRVKPCLEDRLATALLQMKEKPTCKQISDIGFGSHPGCYVETGFCKIPFSDWLKVANFIKGTLLTSKSLTIVGEGLRVLSMCTFGWNHDASRVYQQHTTIHSMMAIVINGILTV